MSNYDILIEKLDAFTRKYYVNQLLRGTLYSIGLLSLLFTITVLLEHFTFQNLTPSGAVMPRKVLFYSFLLGSIVAVGYWMVVPLIKYFRLGKVISHEQAAEIVGTHFTTVKDKLLNVLQLKKQSDSVDGTDTSLLFASINQKTEELKPVPFKSAIDLTQNRRYVRFVWPPVFAIILLLMIAPGLIPSSAGRLLNNNREYEPEAPFAFTLLNENPQVRQYDDYEMVVKIDGKEIPAEAFVEVDNYSYKLTKKEGNLYSFTFNKVAKDTEFRFRGAGVESKKYTLDVLEKPNINGFEITLQYPAYTGRKNESLANIGDLVVPAGTQITWAFTAKHTDALGLKFGTQRFDAVRQGSDYFTFKRSVRVDELYRVFVSNAALPKADSVAYTITVVPDLYPTIAVEKFVDSTNVNNLHFIGQASDDYGLRTLTFNYKIEHEGKEGDLQTTPLKLENNKQSTYNHSFYIDDLHLEPGDKVTYYFETFDNDAVNGSKSSRTDFMVYAMPTVEQFEQKEQSNNKEIEKSLEAALKKAEELKQAAKKLQEEILQKKDMDWQDRKKMEKLVEQQKELEKEINEGKEMFKENMKNQEQYQKPDEQLLEKQKQLEKLFNEALDPETKELFKKMEELLQQMDKKEMLKELEKMNMDQKEVSKELDRMMELFKQLEFEKNMKDAIEKLDDLAKKQEELSEKTDKNELPQDQIQKEQEQINKEFQDAKEKIQEAQEKNEELEQPNQMEDTKEQQEDIQKEMNNLQKQLQKEQENKKSAKKQKGAADKMKDLANSLAKSMAQMEQEQMEEDMKAMRQLLENIVGLSFDQEKLTERVVKVDINTPAYVSAAEEQRKVKDDFRIIEDSLQALAKRVFQIQGFVTDKVSEINNHLNQSLATLEERQKPQANVQQQYTMTGLNDLALMLSETLEQMQMQAASEMEGQQMCQKPGNGKGKNGKKPKKGNAGNMQKELNDQLKEMQQQMKDGKVPNGMGGQSKQFAQMAAKQAAIRQALQQMQKEMQEQGKGGSGGKELQEMIDQMNKTETELVNRQFNNETMKRQAEILTRLLESERAERQRDQDEQRESQTAKEQARKMPPALEEYLKKRQAEIDLYKTVSPVLKPYYKKLVEQYLN